MKPLPVLAREITRATAVAAAFIALAQNISSALAADLLAPPAATTKLPTLAPLSAANPAEWQTQRAALHERWQKFLGEFPSERAPLKTEILATEELPDFTRQHIKYQIEDGVFTDAFLLTPKPAKPQRAAIVVFHQTVKTHIRQAAGIDESVPELNHGPQLARRGYVVLCPRCYIFDDGPGFAGNVTRVQTRHPRWTGMARMAFDGVRAADLLESLPGVDARRIGALGHSLGAKETLFAAALDERFKAAVFSEGGIGLTFSNWEAPWYLGKEIRKENFPLENHQLIALIAPRGFLLLAGESADSDKSWAFINAARPIYQLLGAEKNLGWLNHRSGHRYPEPARAVAEEFLDRILVP